MGVDWIQQMMQGSEDTFFKFRMLLEEMKLSNAHFNKMLKLRRLKKTLSSMSGINNIKALLANNIN